MEQIIFFTQFRKLRDINILITIPENGYFLLNNNTPGSLNRIIIIDESNTHDNSNLMTGYDNYFIYHKLTKENEFYNKIIDNAQYKFEDHHINGYTRIYHEINGIRNGYSDQIFENLKKKIIDLRLEGALEFLHQCLTGVCKQTILKQSDYSEDDWKTISTLVSTFNDSDKLKITKQLCSVLIDNKY